MMSYVRGKQVAVQVTTPASHRKKDPAPPSPSERSPASVVVRENGGLAAVQGRLRYVLVLET